MSRSFLGAARLVLLLPLAAGSGPPCLSDAVPSESRVWINDDEDQPIAIGLFESDWDSSYLFTKLVQILIEEVLGYHTVTNQEPGSSGAAAHFALAGCLDWNSPSERKCDLNETRMHLVMDSWMSNWPLEAAAIAEYPHLVAEDLGSMGYSGVEGIFLTREVLSKAYEAEGLALNFYLSYNQTHHDAKRYLDGLAAVNTSRLNPCNETNFFNVAHMQNYLKWTGDSEGLETIEGVGLVAKCVENLFWLSPACRSDASSCIATLTAGSGWAMQDIMQWATVYAMPLALGVTKTFGDEVDVVKEVDPIFYWWQPDSSFVLQWPTSVIFPPYSAAQREKGDRKTAAKATYVNKACSNNLGMKAPKVRDFASKINFELEETQQLLSLTSGGMSFYEASCQWIRNNRDRWGAWVSGALSCSSGNGLADAAGAFLTSRENARICKECPSGRFSERFTDDVGTAYRCTICQAGSSQSKAGESACPACVRGTYTNKTGQLGCEVCPIGSYQNEEGQMECKACPEDRTTLLLAAGSKEDCVCRAKYIEGNDGTCVECPEGLICPKGSTVKLLLDGESDLRQGDELPSVDSGYRSTSESPLEIYRCVSHCPGGRPGSCDAGRIGVTCGECPKYEFIQNESCGPCQPVHSVLWALACPLLFLCVVASYYMSNGKHKGPRADTVSCATAIFGLLVVFCEIVAVMQSVAVQWPKGLAVALSYFEVFGLSFDNLGLGCLAGNQVRSYILQSAFFPTVVVGSFVLQLLSKLIPLPERLQRWKWTRAGTVNMLGHLLQEGFITMSNIAFIPFSCFSHPSGAESLLTATNILCGSEDHRYMQAYGVILGLLCLAFLSLCSYAALKAPSWSEYPVRMSCIRFLIDRFRPDVWWFGVILLVRGPALSMPAIIAANVPGLQMTGLLGIMLISVLIQVRFLPWNAPLANVADAASSGFLLILLSIGIARLPPPPGQWASGVLDTSAAVVALLILLVWVVVCFSVFFLLCRKVVKGKREDSRIINLGKVGDPGDLVVLLDDMARNINGWSVAAQQRVKDALSELSVYDYRLLSTSLMLLSVEVGLGSDSRMSLTASPFSNRIISRGVSGKARSIRQTQSRLSQIMKDDADELADAESLSEPDMMSASEPDVVSASPDLGSASYVLQSISENNRTEIVSENQSTSSNLERKNSKDSKASKNSQGAGLISAVVSELL